MSGTATRLDPASRQSATADPPYLPAESENLNMEQKYEGSPRAEIRLVGRRVLRSEVTNDWGLQLRWTVLRDGKVIATVPARAEASYEHPETTPGKYEIVLQMWKYVDYKKGADGEFANSRFVDVSDKVTYTI
jgi:hypothetical protein